MAHFATYIKVNTIMLAKFVIICYEMTLSLITPTDLIYVRGHFSVL